MSIPELLCNEKVCTLLALSLISHCSCLSITQNTKILSESQTEAPGNTRGITLHIQLLSQLSLRYLPNSLRLAETDEQPQDCSVLHPPSSFLQQYDKHSTCSPLILQHYSKPDQFSLYLPWGIDVDDILWPTLQVSCCLSCKKDFDYWFSCIDDKVFG